MHQTIPEGIQGLIKGLHTYPCVNIGTKTLQNISLNHSQNRVYTGHHVLV